MPKKGRGKAAGLDPLSIPVELQTALEALYGHYAATFEQWQKAGIEVPPCFIVVCNNTSTSKLVYDYISGFHRRTEDGSTAPVPGRLPLFRNFDEDGHPLAQPHTLLIDSEQLDSGEALGADFRDAASDEIERFRREIVERTGDRRQAESLSDHDLLREVMNTVGKAGRLGGGTRCVVSVSRLTEGWDARTVTHVLGVRAFGTQLLCEQVVGRALRRQSYDLNEDGLFDVEYADVLGIPFDFTAKPVVVPPQRPRQTVQVKAITPDRDACEIRFPRVQGYRVELPEEHVDTAFDESSTFVLTPEIVGPSITHNTGIIGEGVDLDLIHRNGVRTSELVYHLTRTLMEQWREPNQGTEAPPVRPAQTHRAPLAQRSPDLQGRHESGSVDVPGVGRPSLQTNHAGNRVAPLARTRGQGGSGSVQPYRSGSEARTYLPDFVVLVDDGEDDLLRLVVEIKGFRREDAKEKKATMETYWVPGVNRLGAFGRWAFAEFTDVYTILDDFGAAVGAQARAQFDERIEGFLEDTRKKAATWLAAAGGSEPELEYVARRRSEPSE